MPELVQGINQAGEPESMVLSTLWGSRFSKSSAVMASGRVSKKYLKYQYGSRPLALTALESAFKEKH